MSQYPADHDRRHWLRMLSAIADGPWDTDTARLGTLLSRLDGLLNALEACDAALKTGFQRHWGIMEEVHALALDEGRTHFSDEERRLLARAASDLKLLIEVALGPPAS